MSVCDNCGKSFNPSDGIVDDGAFICGECVSQQIERSDAERRPQQPPSTPTSKEPE